MINQVKSGAGRREIITDGRKTMMEQEKKIRITKNALLGQAVGDAFGVPLEFLSRIRVRTLNITEMTGSDSELPIDSRWGLKIPKGSWSDDTSMTVASMASFIENDGRIDYDDQMNRFIKWWNGEDYCCLSYPFGLGRTVGAAMFRYQKKGLPVLECGGREVNDNGNGALMRILPFSLYCIFHQLSAEETVLVTGNGSAITHGHEISRLCCFIWTEFLRAISEDADIKKAISHIEAIPYQNWFSEESLDAVGFITKGRFSSIMGTDIEETGYVVDTLYSALYSLYYADDYETSILNAMNLGFDTDTAGAVTGMAAGMLYGLEGIPERWLNVLGRKDYLESVARDFAGCFCGTDQ